MTLRTRNFGWQWLAWIGTACVCAAAYALAVRLFGTGDAAAWYAPEQMRFFLPCAVVFGFVAYETRWDGIRRKVKSEKAKVEGPGLKVEKRGGGGQRNCKASSQDSRTSQTFETWERAKELPHERIPDPEKDAEYLALVLRAADGGCVPALEALCGYARKRGATVEAYFWAARAEKCGSTSARSLTLALRKEWLLAGCPPQHGNVHSGFSKERGSVARALLRMACGIDVALARQRIRKLAEDGQADALFFVQRR